MVERNFYEVLSKIEALLPKELVDKLEKDPTYWAPELSWLYLTQFINMNVEKRGSNRNSVAIYSILCNCSEEETIKKFKESGYNF